MRVAFVTAAIWLIVPWAVHATEQPDVCSVLFMSDTHGPAASNEALVDALLAEDGITAVLHGGDVADAADLYGPWWDDPFRDVEARWPFYVAQGNHDATSVGTKAAFAARFPVLPARLECGAAEIYILPYWPSVADVAWLTEQVTTSTAAWRVLVVHRPVWPVNRGNAGLRGALWPVLPRIDLVLSGHEHVSSDSTHEVGSAQVRQIIEVSGSKKYECPVHPVATCEAGETAYWRLDFYEDEIRASRQVISAP